MQKANILKGLNLRMKNLLPQSKGYFLSLSCSITDGTSRWLGFQASYRLTLCVDVCSVTIVPVSALKASNVPEVDIRNMSCIPVLLLASIRPCRIDRDSMFVLQWCRSQR